MKNTLTIKQQQAIIRLFDMIILSDNEIKEVEELYESMLMKKLGLERKAIIKDNLMSRKQLFDTLRKLSDLDKEKVIKAVKIIADSDDIRTTDENNLIKEIKEELK